MKTSKNAHAAHAGLCANIAKATRTAVTTALICVLLAGMLTACGGDSSKSYDLQEVYQEILAAQPENTEVYPGLGAIKLKQEVCYQHAVTGFCEIMLVEVADSKDVQSVVDIFNQRIDTASDDSFYPETAQLWAQNAQVQTEGNYVAMVALPDGYTVPEKIFS